MYGTEINFNRINYIYRYLKRMLDYGSLQNRTFT